MLVSNDKESYGQIFNYRVHLLLAVEFIVDFGRLFFLLETVFQNCQIFFRLKIFDDTFLFLFLFVKLLKKPITSESGGFK